MYGVDIELGVARTVDGILKREGHCELAASASRRDSGEAEQGVGIALTAVGLGHVEDVVLWEGFRRRGSGDLLVAGGELNGAALDVDALMVEVLILERDLNGGLCGDEGGEENKR